MIGFFAFMMILALGVLALASGLQWLGGRRGSLDGPGPSAAQLDRLETSLGTLEARIDDLQEQQRFLERLVAERPERQALPGRRNPSEGEGEAESDPEVDSILFDTGDGRGE